MTEVMIVAAILATVSVAGLTKYRTALRVARVEKSKLELRTLAFEIDLYHSNNKELPETLEDVGRGGMADPWGNPYMYLNFQAGTGSAMDFVTSSGLIDPAAVGKAKGKGKGLTKSKADGGGADGGATTPKVADIKRKDSFLFPLNSDYDLFSLGPNGQAFSSISSDFSLDDVIRANNGGFYGVASDY